MVLDNLLVDNAIGVDASNSGSVDIIGRNVLVDNATDFVDDATADVGPSGTAAAATSPWANIVH